MNIFAEAIVKPPVDFEQEARQEEAIRLWREDVRRNVIARENEQQRKRNKLHNHTLYRCWDRRKRLLYVGISLDAGKRVKQHGVSKDWWTQVANITLEHFGDRESLEFAERQAIAGENPLYNKVGITTTEHENYHVVIPRPAETVL